MPNLSLRNIVRRYGDVAAVAGVDLQIASGEFVSLLGPSGCGKTTTLRMIAGFIDPTEGTIELDGKILSSPTGSVPPERRGMSMIFQSYAIWPNMTVAENVAFGLKLRKLTCAERDEKAEAMLKIVQLWHLRDRYPAELSGGQQQRVALARAIVVQPAVLLLDEPLSNLDANLREEMRSEIKRLHDRFEITTVYVTHDQAEAMATSDRIAVMHQGRVEQIDDPFTLYTKPRTPFVASFIGRTNLVTGKRAGDDIVFDQFALRAGFFADIAAGQDAEFSIRPESFTLYRQAPVADPAQCVIAGEIVQRSFLGTTWDYVVAPRQSGLRLKVSGSPMQVFEVGQAVWLGLDPQHVSCLAR